jgi:signal transduction histidine kinase
VAAGVVNAAVASSLTVALGNAYSGRIVVTDSSLKVVKDTYGVDENKIMLWENAVSALKGDPAIFTDDENEVVIVAVPIYSLQHNTQSTSKNGEQMAKESVSPVDGILIITRATNDIKQEAVFIRNILLEVCVVLGILSFALALFLSRKYSRPMEKFAERIHDLRETGTAHEYHPLFTENQDISEEFDKFREKADTVEESREAFVSNVSHELKTPLASIKVLADSLNSFEGAPIEMYKEFMTDITAEIDRETQIINDLLTLVKMDKGARESLNISSVNMNELIELIMKRLKPIAEKQNIELVFESFRPVVAEVDKVKMTLAITNLIENGIKYNKETGWVHVSINSDHQFCYIKVQDCGIGMPKESIEHIFERFYRVDKSHSREIGGTGLGLAITKSSIVMHRGDIKVHSVEGEGTTFDVRIPLNYIEEAE